MKLPFSDKHLVMSTEWKAALRLPSMWLGVMASAITSYVVGNPAFFFTIINYFPSGDRPLYAVLFGAFVLLTIAVARLTKVVSNDANDPK